MFAMATRVSARPGGHAGLNQRTTSSSRGHVFQSAKSSRAVLSRPPRHRHGVSIKTSASLPETSAIAGDGVEGYVRVLELAYGDENLGNEVRDRMGTDRQFSIGIRGAMTDVSFSDRLRAAIDGSPYMQRAATEASKRRADGDAVQAVMGDDSVQGQIAEMTKNPEALRQTQEQSEELLKRVCGELVDGVKEYRDEFEPDADVLIAKFTEIQENGYTAFVRICASDVKVKNAVINALYDEMDTARATAAAAIELEKETTQ